MNIFFLNFRLVTFDPVYKNIAISLYEDSYSLCNKFLYILCIGILIKSVYAEDIPLIPEQMFSEAECFLNFFLRWSLEKSSELEL